MSVRVYKLGICIFFAASNVCESFSGKVYLARNRYIINKESIFKKKCSLVNTNTKIIKLNQYDDCKVNRLETDSEIVQSTEKQWMAFGNG